MRVRQWVLGSWSLLLLAVMVGCGGESGPKKFEVTGTVTFKKQPLDYGSIQFMPAEGSKGGSFSGAEIKGGKYTIPAASGLVAGTYRVIISSGDKDPKAKEEAMPGESGPPAKERIPPEYNANSKQQVEVTAGKGNVFNFDIP